MFREEKGSAFLLVVFMILLFALIGVAVLGATIGGAKRAQKTEDNVQSVHLADKALSEVTAIIMARFNNKSIRPADFVKEVEDFVEKSNITLQLKGESDLDKTNPSYKFIGIKLLTPAQAKDAPPIFQTTLRVTVQAEVNGLKKQLSQDITLNTFPDFLRYAMGSEGDVIINGAPYFRGNIYAGGDLKIHNIASYTYHGMGNSARTQYLYVDPVGADASQTNGIQDLNGDDLGSGKVLVHSKENIKYWDSTQYTDLPQKKYDESSLSNQYHLNNKVEFTETKKFISIQVAESFVDKAFDALGANVDPSFRDALWNAYSGSPINPEDSLMNKLKEEFNAIYPDYAEKKLLTVPTLPIEPLSSASDQEIADYTDKKLVYDQAMAKLNERLSILTGPVIVDGDLIIGKQLNKIYYSQKGSSDWLIINGDLTVQNDNPDMVIPIRANILVKGKITLAGKLEMDSTIFSLDRVHTNEIVDAQIHGLNQKQLVMIANGPIDIYRVDSFQKLGNGYSKSSVNTLAAFFYTDKKAMLYGVGSLFWIHGGFFAKDGITINAVLGDTNEAAGQDVLEFANQDEGTIDQRKARFVIDYNKEIFEDQNIGLPRVNKIRVGIGQKKLVTVNP